MGALQERAQEAARERQKERDQAELESKKRRLAASRERKRQRQEHLRLTVAKFAEFLEVEEDEITVVGAEKLDTDYAVEVGKVTIKVDGLTLRGRLHIRKMGPKPDHVILVEKQFLRVCSEVGCDEIAEKWASDLADIGEAAERTDLKCSTHGGDDEPPF